MLSCIIEQCEKYKYEPQFAHLFYVYRRKAVSLCFLQTSLINMPFLKKPNSLNNQCCLRNVRTIKQETGWIIEWFHTTGYYLMKKVWKDHAFLTGWFWLKRDGQSKFVFVGWIEIKEADSICVVNCSINSRSTVRPHTEHV